MKGENSKFKHPMKTNRRFNPSTKSFLPLSLTNSFLTCPLRSKRYPIRQYLKFHSRAFVSVLAPNERYRVSIVVVVGSSVEGAKNRLGMWGERECGRGNRNRRSRRSLLNNAIK
jgi:hypothetical protein